VLLRLVSDDKIAQNLGRDHIQHLLDGDHNSCGAVHGTDTFEMDPLIDYGEWGGVAVDLLADFLARIIGASGSGVVLAEGLHGHIEYGPAGRPVHPPDQLSSAAHGHGSGKAAGALVVHGLRFQVKAGHPGGVGSPAGRADGIKGAPALRHIPARDLL